MTKKLYYMKWNPGDYDADTRHLSLESDGLYRRMLDAAWRCGGSLPADDATLAKFLRLSPRTWRRLKPSILEFWDEREGRLFNNRMAKELGNIPETSPKEPETSPKEPETSPKELANGTGKPLKPKETSTPIYSIEDKENSRERKDLSLLPGLQEGEEPPDARAEEDLEQFFETFWKAYPPRSGSRNRKGTRTKYLSLLKEGVVPECIQDGVERYAKWAVATGNWNSSFVMMATTWLNREGWQEPWDSPPTDGGPPSEDEQRRSFQTIIGGKK